MGLTEDLQGLDLEGVAMTAAVTPDGALHKVAGLQYKLGPRLVELARAEIVPR